MEEYESLSRVLLRRKYRQIEGGGSGFAVKRRRVKVAHLQQDDDGARRRSMAHRLRLRCFRLRFLLPGWLVASLKLGAHPSPASPHSAQHRCSTLLQWISRQLVATCNLSAVRIQLQGEVRRWDGPTQLSEPTAPLRRRVRCCRWDGPTQPSEPTAYPRG